jgi:hypothetical protein
VRRSSFVSTAPLTLAARKEVAGGGAVRVGVARKVKKGSWLGSFSQFTFISAFFVTKSDELATRGDGVDLTGGEKGPGAMKTVLASAPWFRWLREEMALPSGVTGPLGRAPLARAAANCASERSRLIIAT